MNELIAIGNMKDGVMTIVKRKQFEEAIKLLTNGRYIIKFYKHYKKRSNAQNNSFWGIPYTLIYEALINLGHYDMTLEKAAEVCKENCLPSEYIEKLKSEQKETIINIKTGEIIEMPFRLTTTKLTTIWAMEYYRNMQQFGAEYLGIDIPDPDSDWKNKQ